MRVQNRGTLTCFSPDQNRGTLTHFSPEPPPSAPHRVGPKQRTPAPKTGSAAWGGVLCGVKGLLVSATLLGGCASLPATTGVPLTTVNPRVECTVEAELRSWVVMGWGRHLRLDAGGGCGTRPFSVEYADAQPAMGLTGVVGFGNVDLENRIRAPGGHRPSERVEARYELTRATAECLAELRLYPEAYRLTGPNSSSAMRATLAECGLPLPAHVAGAGGWLESFPGVEHDPGRVRVAGPPEDFGLFAITRE